MSERHTDTTARTAASAARARADDAYTLADGKVDPAGAASAAREVTVAIGQRPKIKSRSQRRN